VKCVTILQRCTVGVAKVTPILPRSCSYKCNENLAIMIIAGKCCVAVLKQCGWQYVNMNIKLLSNINNGMDHHQVGFPGGRAALQWTQEHNNTLARSFIIISALQHVMLMLLLLKKKQQQHHQVGFRGGRAALQWTQEHHNTLARSFMMKL